LRNVNISTFYPRKNGPLIVAREHAMAYGTDDTWRVWDVLSRKEDDLKWCGHPPGCGPQYDSMGRPAEESFFFVGDWAHEQMGRVERVRQALAASGPMAQHIVARRLAGIDLATIWHILISACQDIALYYGGSVLAGGFVGGFGGAFLGGVGAVPGAAAGAAAGGYVGGAILAMLGLKSLVEGVLQSVPEAFNCYKRGFLEAWGPTKMDRLEVMGETTKGDPLSGAFDLANGHAIMVAAILTVLVAYLTRGKGDKAALLNDIRQSPRLGPKVAQWVEQNEDQLRQHPALQPRVRWGAAHDAPPPPPPRRRGPGKEPERSRPGGMPKTKVPCFTTKGLPQGSVPEFDRQLAGQEAGINDMTVDEYLKGREAFKAGTSVRDPNVARNARVGYQDVLEENSFNKLREQGMSWSEAKAKSAAIASDKMKTLAALHNPDMVVAGKDRISDFGNRNINSRIGAQWNKRQRLAELDKAASGVPVAMRSSKMNARLERCK
jgi:hypothetical protein